LSVSKQKIKCRIFEQKEHFNFEAKHQQQYQSNFSRPIQYSKPPRSTPAVGPVGPSRPTSLQPPPAQEPALTHGPRANSPSFMDPNYCLCCPPNDLRFSDALRAKQRAPLRRPFIVGDVSRISFFISLSSVSVCPRVCDGMLFATCVCWLFFICHLNFYLWRMTFLCDWFAWEMFLCIFIYKPQNFFHNSTAQIFKIKW